MKSLTNLLIGAILLLATSGCANGPFKRFFRGGAPCNTCNPPMGQIFGQGWGGSTVANCENGNCGTPAPALDSGPAPGPASFSANRPGYGYPGDSGGVPSGVISGLTPLDQNNDSGPMSRINTSGLRQPTGSGSLNGNLGQPQFGTLPDPNGR